MMHKHVLIVSGGMDSLTMADDLLKNSGSDCGISSIVSFNYGQNHKKELTFAQLWAEAHDIKHHHIDLWSSGYTDAVSGATALLRGAEAVPEGHYAADNMTATIVPNRNMIMISIAGAIACAEDAAYVNIGVHGGDHFIYPDCRDDFISAANTALNFATDGKVSLIAPFVYSTKEDIARVAIRNRFDLSQTWSCYKGGEVHCGKCGTCVERLEAIHGAILAAHYYDGVEYEDKTVYEDNEYWKTVI